MIFKVQGQKPYSSKAKDMLIHCVPNIYCLQLRKLFQITEGLFSEIHFRLMILMGKEVIHGRIEEGRSLRIQSKVAVLPN